MSPIGTKRTCQNASTMSALGGNPDGICSLRAFPLLTQSGRRLASRAITTNALLDRDFSHPEVRTKGRPTAARGRLHAQAVAAAQCPGRGPTALASLLCRLVAERSPSKTTFSFLSCDTGSTGGESAFGAASAHNKLPTGSSL